MLPDGTVVTEDGEYLGTWSSDESDAIYEFTPDGASEVLFSHPFMRPLCEMIEEWNASR